MKEIIGYKAFNEGLINRYGVKFEQGLTYSIPGTARFGNDGNGFHLCTYLEDTLRYFDALEENIDICRVLGSGDMHVYNDDYYGYYDMYAVSQLKILHLLSKEEILAETNKMWFERLKRFIMGYRISQSELENILANNCSDYQKEELKKIYKYYQNKSNF